MSQCTHGVLEGSCYLCSEEAQSPSKVEPLNLTVFLPKDEHAAFEREFQEFVESRSQGHWTKTLPTKRG